MPGTRFGRGLTAVARRGSPTALAAAAVALAAGLSACGGSSGPGALPVHCTGHTLAAPDSGAVGFDGNALAVPPAAVPGVPHPAGAVPATGVPAILDPADPRYGYSASGWDVVRVPGTGGRACGPPPSTCPVTPSRAAATPTCPRRRTPVT